MSPWYILSIIFGNFMDSGFSSFFCEGALIKTNFGFTDFGCDSVHFRFLLIDIFGPRVLAELGCSVLFRSTQKLGLCYVTEK